MELKISQPKSKTPLEKHKPKDDPNLAWALARLKGPPSIKKPQSSLVQILVGARKTEFIVYKDFLCYYSPQFACTLHHANWDEPTKPSICIEDVDVDAFGLFVQWLYTQEIKIFPFTKDSTATDSTKVNKDRPGWDALVNLWILAEFLDIPALQNLTTEAILEKFERLCETPTGLFPHIYDNTSPGSLLRKLVVDMCVWGLLSDSSHYRKCNLPADILLDMVVGFNERCLEVHAGHTPVNPLKDLKNYLVEVPDETSSYKQALKKLVSKVPRVADFIDEECRKSSKLVRNWLSPRSSGDKDGNSKEWEKIEESSLSELMKSY